MPKSFGHVRTAILVASLLLPSFADAQVRPGVASTVSAQAARLLEFGSNISSTDIAFSPNGALLASAGADNLIRLWAIPTGTQTRVFRGHTAAVTSIAWSPDGRVLASAGQDKSIRLWNPTTGTVVRTVAGLVANMTSLAFSPDGRLLASGGADNIIRLWNVATGTVVRSIRGHSGTVFNVAFSSNGELLASSSGDGSVRIWRVSDGQMVQGIQDDRRYVSGVSFSPSGLLVAHSSGFNMVRVWEVASRRTVHLLEGRSDEVSSAVFRPNGRQLAAISLPSEGDDNEEGVAPEAEEDGDRLLNRQTRLRADDPYYMLHIWDVSTGALVRTYDTGDLAGTEARYSPDGQWLAVGGYSGIQLWLADGFDEDVLAAHPDIAKQLAPRDEFETTAEFQARLTLGRQAYQDTLQAVRKAAALALAQRIAQSREEVRLPAFSEGGLRLAQYDADAGRYYITIDGRDTTITISPADARELSQRRAEVTMEAVRQLGSDGCTLLLLNRVLLHPTNGQRYSLGSQSLADARRGQPEGCNNTNSPSASGVGGGTGPVNVDQPYFDFQVEKPVGALPGSIGPRYPDVLRSGGIEGEVLAQFVVDTTGRIEVSTFRVLRSDHADFEQAVRSALPNMRFSPAEIGGRKVRQLVQQPFIFALQR